VLADCQLLVSQGFALANGMHPAQAVQTRPLLARPQPSRGRAIS